MIRLKTHKIIDPIRINIYTRTPCKIIGSNTVKNSFLITIPVSIGGSANKVKSWLIGASAEERHIHRPEVIPSSSSNDVVSHPRSTANTICISSAKLHEATDPMMSVKRCRGLSSLNCSPRYFLDAPDIVATAATHFCCSSRFAYLSLREIPRRNAVGFTLKTNHRALDEISRL